MLRSFFGPIATTTTAATAAATTTPTDTDVNTNHENTLHDYRRYEESSTDDDEEMTVTTSEGGGSDMLKKKPTTLGEEGENKNEGRTEEQVDENEDENDGMFPDHTAIQETMERYMQQYKVCVSEFNTIITTNENFDEIMDVLSKPFTKETLDRFTQKQWLEILDKFFFRFVVPPSECPDELTFVYAKALYPDFFDEDDLHQRQFMYHVRLEQLTLYLRKKGLLLMNNYDKAIHKNNRKEQQARKRQRLETRKRRRQNRRTSGYNLFGSDSDNDNDNNDNDGESEQENNENDDVNSLINGMNDMEISNLSRDIFKSLTGIANGINAMYNLARCSAIATCAASRPTINAETDFIHYQKHKFVDELRQQENQGDASGDDSDADDDCNEDCEEDIENNDDDAGFRRSSSNKRKRKKTKKTAKKSKTPRPIVLLEYVLNHMHENGYMCHREKKAVARPVVVRTEDGHVCNTVAINTEKTIQQSIIDMFARYKNRALWVLFKTTFQNPAKIMADDMCVCNDPQFQPVDDKVSPMCFVYRNGTLVTYDDDGHMNFSYHGDYSKRPPDGIFAINALLDCELPDVRHMDLKDRGVVNVPMSTTDPEEREFLKQYASGTVYKCDLDINNPSTYDMYVLYDIFAEYVPTFLMISQLQNWDDNTRMFFWVMVGRIISGIPNSVLDQWQVHLELIGNSGTGKSSLCDLVTYIFGEDNTGLLASGMEEGWGMSLVLNKPVCICSETSKNSNLRRDDFNKLADRGRIYNARKFQDPSYAVFTGNLLLTGNEPTGFKGEANSLGVERRRAALNMPNSAEEPCPDFLKRLKSEAGFIHMMCVMAYRWAVWSYGPSNFWAYAPRSVRQYREQVMRDTDPLFAFLTSEHCMHGPGKTCTEQKFKMRFRKYCQDNGIIRKFSWNTTLIQATFKKLKMKMVQRVHENGMTITRIEGCALVNEEDVMDQDHDVIEEERDEDMAGHIHGDDAGVTVTLKDVRETDQ